MLGQMGLAFCSLVGGPKAYLLHLKAFSLKDEHLQSVILIAVGENMLKILENQ